MVKAFILCASSSCEMFCNFIIQCFYALPVYLQVFAWPQIVIIIALRCSEEPNSIHRNSHYASSIIMKLIAFKVYKNKCNPSKAYPPILPLSTADSSTDPAVTNCCLAKIISHSEQRVGGHASERQQGKQHADQTTHLSLAWNLKFPFNRAPRFLW